MTKSSCTLTDLNPDERIYIRVAAIGAVGQGPWGPTATARVSELY